MSIELGSSVSSEQRGYGRGLILGLTMAESMLLLVFCLLLAAGAIIIKEREAVEKIIAEKAAALKQFEEQKKESALLAEQLQIFQKTAANPAEMDKAWRELTRARNVVAELAKHGLTLSEVTDKAAVLKEIIDRKITTEEVVKAVAVIDTLKKLTEEGIQPDSEQLDELVKIARVLRERDIGLEELEKLTPAIDVLRKQVLVATSEVAPEDQLLEMLRKAKRAEEDEKTAEPHEWPPIINLSETNGHFFRSGSAELSPNFEQVLRESVAHQIAGTASRYKVDVIEVIGHTDEQRMGKRPSNLDDEIKSVLSGTASASKLQPADNAGLGLARAIAVAEVLKRDPSLSGLTILPMSGAQLILPDDTLTDGAQAGDITARRRIEIRVRKRNPVTPTDIEFAEKN